MKKLFCFALLLLLVQALLAQSIDQLLADGNKAYRAKDYPTAEKSYRAAVQLDPKSMSAYQGLANCEYMEGRKVEALEDYKRVLTLNPQSPGVAKMIQSLEAQGVQAPGLPEKPMSRPAGYDSWTGKAFEIDGMGGMVITVPNGSRYSSNSITGEIGFFYFLDPQLSLGITGDLQRFSRQSYDPLAYLVYLETSATVEYLNVQVAAKYRLAGKTLRPYILGGGGISVDTVNAKIVQYNSSTSTTTPVSDSSTSTLNPMVELGVGFEFPLFANAGLFFEGKYQLVLSQGGSGFLVPIDGGLSVLF